jgi:hypothetical protein
MGEILASISTSQISLSESPVVLPLESRRLKQVDRLDWSADSYGAIKLLSIEIVFHAFWNSFS